MSYYSVSINLKNQVIMDKQEIKSAEQYTAPDVEVIEIELTQNILQASGSGGLDDFDDGGSAW
jgi:hypothetical protein